MSFWSDRRTHEPLRQYRWVVIFGALNPLNGRAGTAFSYALKECKKPSYKIDTSQHRLLNHTFNYPKNLVWNPVSVKMVALRDKEGVSLGTTIHKFINSVGYYAPGKLYGPLPTEKIIRAESNEDDKSESNENDKFHMQQINKTDQSKYLGPIAITQLDANGQPCEVFYLHNPLITDVDFGNLNYGSEDFVEITFSIIYDHATIFSYTSEWTSELSPIQPSVLQELINNAITTLNEIDTAGRAINRGLGI